MAPIETVTGGDSSTTTGEFVQISATELADLQTRASQSSQNFERFRKANETLEQYETRIAELEAINAPAAPPDIQQEARVIALEHTVKGLTTELAMARVLEAYPVLKGKEADFEEYRKAPENAGMSLATAAKAFVTDKELLAPRRPGLEAPTGGAPAPTPSGKLSAEDAAKLRNSNFKAYSEGLRNGTIQIE